MRAEDQFAIRDLIARYCHACDDGDVVALTSLFADDARYIVGEHTYDGSESIAAHFVDVAPIASVGKHVTTNTVVDQESDEAASAISDWVYLVDGGGLVALAAGRYVDQFTKRGAHWAFASRQILVFDPKVS